MKKNIKKSIVEDINFEIELIDDLLREINSVRLNESFLDSLKNFFGGFSNFLQDGMGAYLGKSESLYNEKLASSAKMLGSEVEGELDIEENEKDLIAWAGAQEYVEIGLNKIEELLKEINTLPGPIPDPEEEGSMEKWEQGGRYAGVSENIAMATGVAAGVVSSLSSPEMGRSETFKGVEGNMKSAAGEKTMIGFLKSILLLVENIAASDWINKLKKANQINSSKFKTFGVKIRVDPVIAKAEIISKTINDEIGRLEGMMNKIEKNFIRKEKESAEEAEDKKKN